METETPISMEFILKPGESVQVDNQQITLMRTDGESITLGQQTSTSHIKDHQG